MACMVRCTSVTYGCRGGALAGNCTTYHCCKGGPAEGLGQETDGCPLYTHGALLSDNRDCVLCMVCLKVRVTPYALKDQLDLVRFPCQPCLSFLLAAHLHVATVALTHEMLSEVLQRRAGLPAQERRVPMAHPGQRSVDRPHAAAGGGQPPVHAARRRRASAMPSPIHGRICCPQRCRPAWSPASKVIRLQMLVLTPGL